MRKLPGILRGITVLLILDGGTLGAQPEIPEKLNPPEIEKNINFFLDCDDCDLDYIRRELAFVSFVRDPLPADVHILVTGSGTGSGGRKYFLKFIGKKMFTGTDNEYTVITEQSDSEDEIRKKLIKPFQTGILQYYTISGFINRLIVRIEEQENRKADEMLTDPWKKWIFSIESSGKFLKEQSQNEYSLATEAVIRKTTEKWKGALSALYETNRENYFDDSTRIVNRQDAREISARYIRSITNRLSARIYGEYSSTTFRNIKNKLVTSLAAEYNIFPWNESHTRIVAFKYQVGISAFNYIEETVYGRMHETTVSESIELRIALIRPWGKITAELGGSHLLHDFSKNYLSFESEVSVRVSKNLSVFCDFESDIIHDQLYLPKGDISIEDLLLKRRKLSTTYEMSGRLGLRFTFGSIYNNVVNERF